MINERAIALKALEYEAARHSNSNEWLSPVAVTQAEADEAWDQATSWQGDIGLPDGVELVADIDDGTSHDRSSVRVFRAEGHTLYSYNNNAWGHADVVEEPDREDWDEAMYEWMRAWDEAPERWFAEEADMPWGEDDY